MAWSHDGRWLAAGYNDGIVRIWDTATGKERASLNAHYGKSVDFFIRDGVSCVEFGKKNKVLATGGSVGDDAGAVKLWDTSFLAKDEKSK